MKYVLLAVAALTFAAPAFAQDAAPAQGASGTAAPTDSAKKDGTPAATQGGNAAAPAAPAAPASGQ